MKSNIYILIITGIIFVYACKETKTDESNVDVIEIDLNKSKQISYTEWFDSIQIVPLETNDQSLIANIDKVIFNGDLIYIFDRKFLNVLIFDNNGKFLKKTSHLRGQGPNEYISITDLDIDEKGNLLILDPFSYKIRGYNANLEPTNEYDISKDLLPIGTFKILSNEIYFLRNYNFEDDEHINVFSIKENKLMKKICQIVNGGDTKKMVGTKHNNFYKINDTVCFIPNFPHNIVYYYDPEKVEFFPRMEFKIKQNGFSSTMLPKNQDDSYYRNIIGSDDFSFIFDIKETNKYYFSSVLNGKKTYINKYDKETCKNQLINFLFLDGTMLSPQLLIKDNTFYAYGNVSEIRQFIENSKYLSEKYKNILKNISEDDNPYIVKYFIKD